MRWKLTAIIEREANGNRRRGSHPVIQKIGIAGTVAVPVPDHAALRIGTLPSIIRQSGIPEALAILDSSCRSFFDGPVFHRPIITAAVAGAPTILPLKLTDASGAGLNLTTEYEVLS